MLTLVIVGAACAAEQNTDGAAVVHANTVKLPLVFIPNQGQADSSVLFQAKAEGHSIFFTKDAVILATVKDDKPVSFSTTISGINPSVIVSGIDPQPGKANFYIGDDPKDWQSDIPTYGGVKYQDALPGIDLVYKGDNGLLKREFTVAPGADPSAIVITYDGIDNLVYGPDGTLEVTTPSGVITEAAPVAYQVINGQTVAVPVQYTILGTSQAGFLLGSYDKAYTLVIDPQLKYSNYLGGALNDRALGVAVDQWGYAYVTGYTCSTNFPVKAAWDTTGWVANGYSDVFLTKLSPDGKTLVYSTYLGGNATDVGNGIVLNNVNWTYITGYTESTNFPSPLAPNPGTPHSPANNDNAFVARFDNLGQLNYATCFGGSNTTVGTGIVSDSGGGYVYVTGYTNTNLADGFPVDTGVDINKNTGLENTYDAFVVELTPPTAAPVHGTYYGGTGNDEGLGIAMDSNDNHYITGWTDSTNLTLLNPAIGYNSGAKDAFVAKWDAGNNLVYSTYVGGSGNDEGHGITLENNTLGYAYITGVTFSPDFPIQDPFFPFNGPNFYTNNFGDAFITKMDPAGDTFNWSTYLGGQNSDSGQAIALDANNNIYVTGYTKSYDFPIVNPLTGFGTKHPFTDVFISMVNANLTQPLNFSTFYGGGLDDVGTGIAVVNITNITVCGYTSSYDFPTFNSYKYINKFDGSKYGGWDDGFVMRLDNVPAPGFPVANFTYDKIPGGDAPLVENFTDLSTGAPTSWQWNFGDGSPNATSTNPTHTFGLPGNYTVTLTVSNGFGTSSIAKGPIVVGTPAGVKFTNMLTTDAIGQLDIANNTTTNIRFFLNYTQYGLLGYNFTIQSNDSSTVEIWSVAQPGWMPNTHSFQFTNSTLPDDNLTLAGVDLYNVIGPGSTNVLLANITLKGIQTNCTYINVTNVTRLENHLAANMSLVPPTPPYYVLHVCVHPLVPLPTSVSPNWTPGMTPNSPYGDGLYWDVNGDGKVDFYDVIDFFINLEWMALNEYAPFFDFNHNGFIDFGDVITLFQFTGP